MELLYVHCPWGGIMQVTTSNQPLMNLGFGGYSCNWGTHIAGLYETEQERDHILLGYLSQGAKEGDLELYCQTEQTMAEFSSKLSAHCPQCEKLLNDPNIFQVQSAKELYYPNGVFSPDAMDDGLGKFFEQSQKNGPRNIRATAEMVWALEAIPGKEHLMVYESRLNYFIPGKPWISICMYNVTKFTGDIIMNVLRTHPFVINKGVITENPYYQDPDIWLKENAPQFLKKNRA